MLIYLDSVSNVAADPNETRDRLGGTGTGDDAAMRRADELEARLREICDPEVVDAKARDAQRRRADEFGGNAALLERGIFTRTPPPGVQAFMHAMT